MLLAKRHHAAFIKPDWAFCIHSKLFWVLIRPLIQTFTDPIWTRNICTPLSTRSEAEGERHITGKTCCKILTYRAVQQRLARHKGGRHLVGRNIHYNIYPALWFFYVNSACVTCFRAAQTFLLMSVLLKLSQGSFWWCNSLSFSVSCVSLCLKF